MSGKRGERSEKSSFSILLYGIGIADLYIIGW